MNLQWRQRWRKQYELLIDFSPPSLYLARLLCQLFNRREHEWSAAQLEHSEMLPCSGHMRKRIIASCTQTEERVRVIGIHWYTNRRRIPSVSLKRSERSFVTPPYSVRTNLSRRFTRAISVPPPRGMRRSLSTDVSETHNRYNRGDWTTWTI